MLHLIPQVKHLEIKDNYLISKSIYYNNLKCDKRIINALSDLPFDKYGISLDINITDKNGEAYELIISQNKIDIIADGSAGAFYAIQTLKQIFKEEKVPCLYIKDYPDFKYRGFYHDITRGKVPTLKTLKKLVDQMAYYKLNSLQLYVEHTYPFEELGDLIHTFGYISSNELKELDEYCNEKFIDFIPSLSTFGHLFELLNQEKYRKLRVLKDFEPNFNNWDNRLCHHTLDPLNPESIELIASLINQYTPNFKSKNFNICCDETFDLRHYCNTGYDYGELYIDFVNSIISRLKAKDKNVMMWGDILLEHPETIEKIPKETILLNWDYSENPSENKIIKFAKSDKKQIVCPGTSAWRGFCEDVDTEEKNISLMAKYGYNHGAIGVLNTNWGDWGNPCPLELSMYGMVVGAEKSWSSATKINKKFHDNVDFILFEKVNAYNYLKLVSEMHNKIQWFHFCVYFFQHSRGKETDSSAINFEAESVQQLYKRIYGELSNDKWKNDEYRQEMLNIAEGICVIAELGKKQTNPKFKRITNTKHWMEEYKNNWISKNKPNEISNILKIFTYFEQI